MITNKDRNYIEEHEIIRKQLWCNVYVAYVQSSNSTNNDGASKWCDIALQRFDQRFNTPSLRQPEENKETSQ